MLALILAGLALAGCQTTYEQMLEDGYPAEYAEGFEAGCGSGRQAAGALDRFRKDVTRYLTQPLYGDGWNDGYRQCQSTEQAAGGFDSWTRNSLQRERDREWRRHVDQAKAQAFRRQP